MKIAIIPSDYPDKRRNIYSFVKQLVDEFARQGHNCTVVAPFPISKIRLRDNYCEYYKVGEGDVRVLRPLFFSFSRLGVSSFFRRHAIAKTIKKLGSLDVIYGHFWKNAFDAYPIALKMKLPLFVASGESDISAQFPNDSKHQSFCDYVSGVICVSTKNKEESISLGLAYENRCLVIPNAVNHNVFRKLEKNACRKKLGIASDIFIVSFVGWFNERKGCERVSSAIKTISGEPVYSFFLGEGEENPDCPNILHKGKVNHEELPIYLNASDVFVLPTRKEGCCNAIIEAMACGLPVISSNRPFNWDVLNKNNSILLDPDNITDIASAILKLRDDRILRESMGKAATKTAEDLALDHRAKMIIEFIQHSIQRI